MKDAIIKFAAMLNKAILEDYAEEQIEDMIHNAYIDLTHPVTTVPFATVGDLIKHMAAAHVSPGDIVLKKNGIEWRFLGMRDEDEAVLQTVHVIDWHPFSIATKQHRWGWNNYQESEIRKALNSTYLERLFGDESSLLEDAMYAEESLGKLFLLSAMEAGFGEAEDALPWYSADDEEELNARRAMTDLEGDEALWWLRSPNPGNAGHVRYVNTYGSLSHNYAYNAHGVAPACVIKINQNHPAT